MLLLLAATALIALALHDRTDAVILLGIVVLSVGLGFINEYRSVRAIADYARTCAIRRAFSAMEVKRYRMLRGWCQATSSHSTLATSFQQICGFLRREVSLTTKECSPVN